MRGINRRQFGMAAGSAGLALAAGSRRSLAQAEPLKIRVGWVVIPASTAPLVLEKKDVLVHYGKSYVLETTRFEGTPPVITALAGGQVDIGPLAFSSFGLAIENAHLDDLRVICDEDGDFANPIEPSCRGGAKIADAIVNFVQGGSRSEVIAK